MGTRQGLEIDAWLRDGGVVVTASDRSARAIASAYHRARRDEGLKAWTAPDILSWQELANREWQQRSRDGRLVLNSIQERAVWTEAVAASRAGAATLSESRHRLASMAMEAHRLLCSYAPRLLDEHTRRGWAGDPAAFSEWLKSFETACRLSAAVSENRLPLELIAMLKADAEPRPSLLLAGFDRVLPLQREFFDAWGSWDQVGGEDKAATTPFYAVRDMEAELTACALWCKRTLAENPDARLLVVTQDAATRRGEIERVFIDHLGLGASWPFEFSLGVALNEIGIVRSAMMLLRWMDGPLQEHELDWLLSAGHAASAEEGAALQARMRDLRRHKKERPLWTLSAFTQQFAKPDVPAAWAARMRSAQQRLQSSAQRSRSPLDWADLAPRLLAEIGWPGTNPRSSAEFQAMRRLQRVMDLCGSLGFDARQISWSDLVSELERALGETLFSPESQDPPILIAGPSESAGLHADAIWFLGASEDTWPTRGNLHPLLPPSVQREMQMPHASPQLDWNLAQAVTTRLLASAPEICFSYPLQLEGADVRPSRIVFGLAGSPGPLPMELMVSAPSPPRSIRIEDEYQIPLRKIVRTSSEIGRADEVFSTLRGGSRFLTMQSHCAFKAFATSRLGAEDWDPAETGLSALQRGNLLHAVMHAIWAGPPRGIRALDDLKRIADRRAFVAERVHEVMQDELPEVAREQMPKRYLELEGKRLTRLVTEWLDYEATRLPFTVIATELKSVTSVGDLQLELRLDRIDRLNDGSRLVVDYKTGDVTPKVWEAPRPEDVQLPLYGGFAIEPGSELGGLVFAKIRAGDMSFAGRVGDAAATLGGRLKNIALLMKNPLGAEQLMGWREEILRLTRDYLEGRADVDPRDPRATCDRCSLQVLCRVQEKPLVMVEEEEEAEDTDE